VVTKSGTAFVILIVSGFPAPRCGATIYESGGSVASVRALQDAAHDGDTITLPAGTFSWTSRLNISKGITLHGATTITGAGTANPTATDATIIQDETPRNSYGLLDVQLNPNQSFRMTGITFTGGSSRQMASTDGAFYFRSQGTAQVNSVRIDHCHFASLYQGKIIHISGFLYGVADHNVMEVIGNSFPFNMEHTLLGSGENGNASWADYP
jgi:hypothetical protein